MTGEEIRNNLHSGGSVYGTHVAGQSHAVSNKILASAPLDFAFVCNEHMPVDRAETSMLCQHFDSMGISPIVRIPFPCAREAAMALDGGAQGIVAPYVETVDEVKEVVGAVHYRPIKGRQLRGILDGTQPPAPATREFLSRFNRHHYAIIGIESVAAYENLDALIGVPGVDGVFMGPHDLSVSLEAPEQWENPALLRLIEGVIVRCRAGGIGVGVHLSPVFSLEQTRRFVSLGMNWILDGADVIFALNGLKQRRLEICGDAGAAANEVTTCITSAK